MRGEISVFCFAVSDAGTGSTPGTGVATTRYTSDSASAGVLTMPGSILSVSAPPSHATDSSRTSTAASITISRGAEWVLLFELMIRLLLTSTLLYGKPGNTRRGQP